MNFLWDIALRAANQGIEEEKLFFAQAEEYSPFYEQAFSCLNEHGIPSEKIELNLLLRFADIFQEILSTKGDEFPEFRRYLIDAALHLILHTDLHHGLTKREIYVKKIMEELEEGIFWRRAAEEFRQIPREKQGRVATLALNQMQTGSSLEVFCRGLLILFPDAMLYQIRHEKKNLILYLRKKKTEQNGRMLQFIQDMFLPVHYDLRIFWEYHFGIIGVEETMKIDEMALY
ncbi:MAG: hypothetical protein ACI4AQ_06985 [Lachnospiraceae bacterium]